MDVPDGISVQKLFEHLEIEAAFKAVAVNREVIHRQEYSITALSPNDRVEIVRPVSGG